MDFTGRQIDNYVLVRLLGKGTFGEVYLAEELPERTFVAIKVLKMYFSPQNIKDFINEARAFRLSHPNITHIRDFGIYQDTPFIVMDYVPQGTLRDRHPRGSRLALETVVSYVKQIAEALQYVHDHRLVHRDVKPENMLVGENNTILLSDFGIAITSYTVDANRTQQPIGTISYIAPEQIQSHAVRASDQYSLGAIVYEWITGTTPFQGIHPQEIMMKHISMPPPPLHHRMPTLPLAVEQVVQRALAKDPMQRYSTIRDFANALEAACVKPTRAFLATFTGHSDGVRAVAWSSDGKWIASAGTDETVQVWDTSSGTTMLTYQGHNGEIWSLSWSPAPNIIASASEDETVQIWNASTGHLLQAQQDHIGAVHTVAWSHSGQQLASGGEDGTVQVWDMRMQRTIQLYKNHTDSVDTLVWSPDDRYIASGGKDKTIQVWEVATARLISTFNYHRDRVTAVSWSPQGDRLASASDDRTVQVWHAYSGDPLGSYHGHSDAVSAVAWSPDGRYIASGSWDTTVHVWEPDIGDAGDTGRLVGIHRNHTNWVNCIAWSPDGKHLASGSWDMTVHIFSLNSTM